MELFAIHHKACVCYAFVRVCVLMPCGRLLGRADLLALACDV